MLDNVYAILSTQKAIQRHQEFHRTDSHVKNNLHYMLAATAANMYNGHEPNSSQNGSNGTVTSCNGCQVLTREIEELKRMILLIMEMKPDLNAPNLYNHLHLFGQHSAPQQPYPDSPFGVSALQTLPSTIFRGMVDRYVQQQQAQNGFQLPVTPGHHDIRFWQAANAASASTSSSSSRDLAPHAASVDMEVDNKFNDRGPNGMEGSGTTSSSSSANAQVIPQSSDPRATPNHNGNIDLLSMFNNDKMFSMNMATRAAGLAPLLNLGQPDARLVAAIAAAQNQAMNSMGHQTQCGVPMQMPSTMMTPTTQLRSSVRMPAERSVATNGSSERKKPNSDDFIKGLRSRNMSTEEIRKIKIPVPEALKFDKNFRPLTEEQIIQQIKSNKKFESMDPSDAMVQLCKKLAEKRVFGTRLMAETTVAAPNHSSYANLPDEGIIYILHVCRKVLEHTVKDEEEFYNSFRDAMKKLAARCRRVRHSKKVSKNRDLNQSRNLILGGSNPCSSANTLLDIKTELSPSIFANAQALAGDDERSSRSSTASNTHLPSSSFGTTASPETPPSLAVTPSSSHTSPMAPPCSSSSPSST
uniref:Bromo domain-containing protein n=1 Tax=Panagrellus redivivus TaxID=6233 RepID=A0A7E4ZTT0_PANRE